MEAESPQMLSTPGFILTFTCQTALLETLNSVQTSLFRRTLRFPSKNASKSRRACVKLRRALVIWPPARVAPRTPRAPTEWKRADIAAALTPREPRIFKEAQRGDAAAAAQSAAWDVPDTRFLTPGPSSISCSTPRAHCWKWDPDESHDRTGG